MGVVEISLPKINHCKQNLSCHFFQILKCFYCFFVPGVQFVSINHFSLRFISARYIFWCKMWHAFCGSLFTNSENFRGFIIASCKNGCVKSDDWWKKVKERAKNTLLTHLVFKNSTLSIFFYYYCYYIFILFIYLFLLYSLSILIWISKTFLLAFRTLKN